MLFVLVVTMRSQLKDHRKRERLAIRCYPGSAALMDHYAGCTAI
jgi:hypothetical protein